ncbi:MAG: polyphosphate kinase 2 family protein [Pseudarcicella sp.]|nr:polyphosphate kinase 2 family protein [Pseudarcicella sp.]
METNKLKFDGKNLFNIKKTDTKLDDFYESEEDYLSQLSDFQDKIDQLQSIMYAHNRYGLLVILQASDAAGKDGTIKAVFSGMNPVGLKIHSFKRPSEEELDHDYLWRSMTKAPERGMITVFNRSYYEEVLVVKTNPTLLTEGQKIPEELTDNIEKVWKNRYQDMANYEQYLSNNGIKIVKVFLNVSKKEQGERLIERIEDPTKNWKFDENDVKVRSQWQEYQQAYQDMINQTATQQAPWYVIPADDKKNMRLLLAKIILEQLKEMKMSYPESSPERKQTLNDLVEIINQQNEE